MAKRPPVRKPFVMITALFAVGCGAKFDIGTEVADTGVASDTRSSSDTQPTDALPSGCPEGKPTVGAACSPEGVSCDYGRCYAPHWTGGEFFHCSKGQWMSGASTCNPPPPDPPCPTDEPMAGAPCYRSPGECHYGDCYGTPTTTATCIGTAWSVSYLSCNPPPPDFDAGSGP